MTKITYDYIRVEEVDGKTFGLTAPDVGLNPGYHDLYEIVAYDPPEYYDADMVRLCGPYGDIHLGAVMDAENMLEAIDNALEEMRVLAAEARAEFGL